MAGLQLYILSGIVLYLALVRFLRYRRRNAARSKFPTRASLRSMTLDDAFSIQSGLAETEFPTVFAGSVFFALFKTYGIPSISRLLVATGQLSKADTASKRAADTGVILTEVVLHHPSSPRAIDGIARMNYLHGLYRKSGKISDDDMLYTLSLFLLEPMRWTTRYEWRALDDVERCAMGTYWRFMGDAMDISFAALESCKAGWTDGLHFLSDLEAWSLKYEADHMLPTPTNETVAKGTINIALYSLPSWLHPVGMDFVSSLLEPRLRAAMKFDDPSWFTVFALSTAMNIRKNLLRYLFLPRPYFFRRRWFSEEQNARGRFNFGQYIAHPWYIKPTLAERWGAKALFRRLVVGAAVPGDGGDRYMPQGYIISELGPDAFCRKGEAEMQATRNRLADNKWIGCPFSGW